MYCINCGNKLDDGAKFCAYCGKPVRKPVINNVNTNNNRWNPINHNINYEYNQNDQYSKTETKSINKGFVITMIVLGFILFIMLLIGLITNFKAANEALSLADGLYYGSYYYTYTSQIALLDTLATYAYIIGVICTVSLILSIPIIILSIITLVKNTNRFKNPLIICSVLLLILIIVIFFLDLIIVIEYGSLADETSALAIFEDISAIIMAGICVSFSKKFSTDYHGDDSLGVESNYTPIKEVNNNQQTNNQDIEQSPIKRGFLITIIVLAGLMIVSLLIQAIQNFNAALDIYNEVRDVPDFYFNTHEEFYLQLYKVMDLSISLGIGCLISIILLIPILVLSVLSLTKETTKFSKLLTILNACLLLVIVINICIEISIFPNYDYSSWQVLLMILDILAIIAASVICLVFSQKFKKTL